MDELYEVLSNTFLFKNIYDEKIKKCCTFKGISKASYEQGAIMQNAFSNKKIDIILKGKAVILSDDNGVIIRKLHSGDVFGVAIMFDDYPKYSTKVIATSQCTVLSLNENFIKECIAYDHNIAFNYLEYLAKKISFLNAKISSYTAKNTENKLLAYLMQLPRENNVITLETDFSAIAKMIGMGRASLYRAFEKLETDGIIKKENKKIILKEV